MVLSIGNITFDCDDVLKVANFWSAALGATARPEERTALRLDRRCRHGAVRTGVVLHPRAQRQRRRDAAAIRQQRDHRIPQRAVDERAVEEEDRRAVTGRDEQLHPRTLSSPNARRCHNGHP